MNEIIAGGCAGLIQTAVGHPLDTIKVQLASASSFQQKKNNRNYAKFNFKSVYRGCFFPAGGAVFINAQTFYTYNYLRQKLQLDPFLSGALCGVVIASLECPVELLKIRMQTFSEQKNHKDRTVPQYRSIVKQVVQSNCFDKTNCSKTIMQNLYQGFGVTCARNFVGTGLYFSVYEQVSFSLWCEEAKKQKPWWVPVISGSVAGMACWGIPYPLDYMKTQIQSSQNQTKRKLRDFLQNKSLRKHMWVGVTPCVARAALVNPFVFFTYEYVKTHF